MIDAYEIGIQLLLQEDVSAGLAVINRGLADVDRAIAATSADLAGLVREEETATKAVAAAVSGRSALVNPSGKKSDAPTEQFSQSAPKQDAPPPPATTFGDKAAAPDLTVAKPVAQAKPKSSQQSDERADPIPELIAPPVSSSAPVKSAVGETVMRDRDANTRQIQPEVTAAVAVQPVATAAPLTSEFQPARSREIEVSGQQPRGSVTPRAAPVTLTASIGREQQSAPAGGQSERARPSPVSALPTRRELPVAPWSGVAAASPQGDATRLPERASAPQSAGRSEAGASGGTVMLDGRLVGQWLSEHMGREASRPPSGPSFFDPRQTPAWNVSGAL